MVSSILDMKISMLVKMIRIFSKNIKAFYTDLQGGSYVQTGVQYD